MVSVSEHVPVMYRYAAKLTKRDPEATQDVVADAVIQISRVDFSKLVYPKSYMNRVVYFTFLARLRSLRSRPETVEIDEEMFASEANQERHAELSLLYERVGPTMREVFFEELTGEEIAQRRGVSRQAVNTMLKREQKKWAQEQIS